MMLTENGELSAVIGRRSAVVLFKPGNFQVLPGALTCGVASAVMLNDFADIAALTLEVEVGGKPSVGFWPGQYAQFLQALAWSIGGPVSSVDALVTGVTIEGDTSEKFRVLWITGASIGLLTGKGSERDEDPAELSGWVRPVASVGQIEFLRSEFYVDPGTEVITEVRPNLRIHFRDDATKVQVSLADRPNQPTRDQAKEFIHTLQKAIAGTDRTVASAV